MVGGGVGYLCGGAWGDGGAGVAEAVDYVGDWAELES